MDVSAYRGKVVIVAFFAAWSPPAVEAVMKLQKLLLKEMVKTSRKHINNSLDNTICQYVEIHSRMIHIVRNVRRVKPFWVSYVR